jgi:predicted dehydrogenase/threonine dehydrogenase-like Zn-dependent dehydrogenase
LKQVLQDLRTGQIDVSDVPCPAALPGHILIQTRASLLSSGSERTILEFGQSSWLSRARSQPDKVRRVLEKIRSDGLLPTLEAVFARLDEPLPLGYCSAGVVVETGAGVEGFQPGDRVACNGPHAEMVAVPKNLCARVPAGVPDERAAFAVLGSIALHGTRLLEPTLGESVVVIGLGLVGLLAVQTLRAHGCRVMGIDPNPARRDLACALGAESAHAPPPEGEAIAAGRAFSSTRGVDAVLIAASAPGNEIIRDAARMCRKRGRIVLVGVVGLDLHRADFYEKELSFRVSCSYGPGRYDPDYEAGGRDYPLPYVRWTEQRNMETVLGMLADGRLDVGRLITTRVPHSEAARAYQTLTSDSGALGIVLQYPAQAPPLERIVRPATRPAETQEASITAGVIGAGDFARTVLLPILRRSGIRLEAIAARRGLTAAQAGRTFGFRQVASDHRAVLENPAVNTVFIVTRHDSHARLTIEALRAGKHVFVEKPLALNRPELEAVAAAQRTAGRHLAVGFNRRFSPHARALKALLAGRRMAAALIMTVNAGPLAADHWLLDPLQGGGRIVGEAVHWIDLLFFLVGHPITSVMSIPLGGGVAGRDSMTVTLGFADGSVGTIHYLANGNRRFPKERLDVAFEGRLVQLDNFRTLTGYGVPGFSRMRTWRQDKGHRSELKTFLEGIIRGGDPAIPFEDLEHVTLASFAAVESAHGGAIVRLQPV